jgi:hypothetical protein
MGASDANSLKTDEHKARVFVYLLYTVSVGIFYAIDINTLSDTIANAAKICGHTAAWATTVCDSSYGLIRYLGGGRESTPVFITATTLFTIIISVHALRIFFGVNFLSDDNSFNRAKEEVFQNLAEDKKLFRKLSDALMVVIQVFLLGFLSYLIKSSYVSFTALVMFSQMLLIIIFDCYNWKVFWADKNQLSTWIILIQDSFLFSISSLLFAHTLVGKPDVGVVNNWAGMILLTVMVLFSIEFFFAWLPSLKSSWGAFKRLASGLASSEARQHLLQLYNKKE